MNTNALTSAPQPGRRNLIFTLVAAAMGTTAVAAIPAQASTAPAIASAPAFDEQAYNRETIAHLMLMIETTRAWFLAHEAGIRDCYSSRAAAEAHDLFDEGMMSARELANTTGLRIDRAAVDRVAQQFKATAKEAYL